MARVLEYALSHHSFGNFHEASDIGALHDGKLSIDQVVEQNHNPYDDSELDTDGIHCSVLGQALQDWKEGEKSREKTNDETDNYLNLM